jgi:hypothetical protein
MDKAAPQAAGPLAARQALDALVFHWGDAYEFTHDGEHGWRARRRDGVGGWIEAMDPDMLHAQVKADYGLNPVSRDFDPGER